MNGVLLKILILLNKFHEETYSILLDVFNLSENEQGTELVSI